MKSVLVTGGAGFIGSHVVRRLVHSRQYTVLNVDALTYAGNLESLDSLSEHPNYGFRQLDICDADAMQQAFRGFRPDAVIHLAAETHVDRSIEGPGAFVNTNIVGTATLLNAALSFWRDLDAEFQASFRFLHVSTDEVYGSLPGDRFFTERSPMRPNSPYAASKAASDHLVRAWHKTYGLPVVISNCSNTYGPYQFPEKLIPTAILAALEGKPIPVYGEGTNIRDWLYVEDHVAALCRILEDGRVGETYNVGGGCQRQNIDVVKQICTLLDELLPNSQHRPHDRLITFVKDRPSHDLRYAVDFTKIRDELGWVPAETFETDLKKTVRWYLDNSDWWKRIRTEIYKGERLGLASTGKNGSLGRCRSAARIVKKNEVNNKGF